MSNFISIVGIVIVLLAICACADPAETRGPIFISAPGKHGITVQTGSPLYDQVRSIVGGDGHHSVTVRKWEQIMALAGGVSAEDEARVERWMERTSHWRNIDVFTAIMNDINADRVIDEAEGKRICLLLPKWEAQLVAARDYVEEYRRVEPETVRRNLGLGDLEDAANKGLEVVSRANC